MSIYISLVFAAYSGTAPGDSVFVIGLACSEAVQYTMSQFISVKANLYVLLVTTILAVPLFIVADVHYGSGTSRNICGKKMIRTCFSGKWRQLMRACW